MAMIQGSSIPLALMIQGSSIPLAFWIASRCSQ
jgi:hypothetical protein